VSPESQKSAPLKRIRDLLRLAASENIYEAQLARRRADDLMRLYGVVESDVVDKSTEVVRIQDGLDGNQCEELARVIAKSRECTSTNTAGKFTFTGFPEAAKDAKELFCALGRIAEDHAEGPFAFEQDRFLWRTCFWLGFVASIQRQLDPEHGPVPQAAMGAIVKKSAVPPVIERAAQGLDEKRDAEIRQPAYAAGLALGDRIPVPTYRRRT
jgi:uncharacterized protein DUF2786